MNGHQRIKAALTGVMPDRRPVMLHSFMVATRYAGHTMKEYRDDPRIAAQCHIQFVEEFGVDGVFFDVDTALMADAIGCPVDFPTNEPARVCGQRLSSLDDVELLEEKDISNHPRIQHSIETMRLLRQYFGHEVFLRGNCDQAPFSLACAMRGAATQMRRRLGREPRGSQGAADTPSRKRRSADTLRRASCPAVKPATARICEHASHRGRE